MDDPENRRRGIKKVGKQESRRLERENRAKKDSGKLKKRNPAAWKEKTERKRTAGN
jgi:hypothetical protein